MRLWDYDYNRIFGIFPCLWYGNGSSSQKIGKFGKRQMKMRKL